MDLDSWALVARAVRACAAELPRPRRRPLYPDSLIALMVLWAAGHDRCMSRACKRGSYGGPFRPRRLPSVSRFTRRAAGHRVRAILHRVHGRPAGDVSWLGGVSYVDGLPLRVGVASRDGDARRGKVMGGFAKGYKLHVIVGPDRRIRVFSVTALNVHETHAAAAMLLAVPHLCFAPDALLLGDSNYDDRDPHKLVDARGGRLFTRPRGLAGHEVTLRQMGPARREFVDLWRTTPSLCRMVYRLRPRVEGVLSCLTSSTGGLGPLPGHVRGIARVTRWVGCKIILYNAKLAAKAASQATAA